MPERLHRRLKEQAKRNRRSLNQEAIAELAASLEGSNNKNERTEMARERMRAASAAVGDLRKSKKRFMSADEISAAIGEGRK